MTTALTGRSVCCTACGGDNTDPRYRACTTCRASWRANYVRKTADRKSYDVLLTALQAIAAGNGCYGAQAGEYKQIARLALAKVGQS